MYILKLENIVNFFDINNIKIGFTYLEICFFFVIKSTKLVSFDLKRPDSSYIVICYYMLHKRRAEK